MVSVAAFDEIKDQIIIFFSLRSLFFVHPGARFMNLSDFVPLVNRFWAADTVIQLARKKTAQAK